ncbi:MAG: hypothetical protein H8E33_00190 [Candidatus Cloacimonetes bacterium]|nr:hypothetical protein [Candidatus Cloacimonadota bacterium]
MAFKSLVGEFIDYQHYAFLQVSFSVIESKEFDYTINTGFGIGMEWQILKNNENFILSFEWPLVFSFKKDDFSIMMYIPQAGIHYYFK